MKFNQKIRSLEEGIKLCTFDKEFKYKIDDEGNTDVMRSVLFNNIVDEQLDETSDNYCNNYYPLSERHEEAVLIKNKLTYKDLTYIKINCLRDIENGVYKNIVCFTNNPSNLIDSSNQTVSFMFSNEPVNNTSSILMCLKEFDDTLEAEELLSNNNDLYLILENKDNLSKEELDKMIKENNDILIQQIEDFKEALKEFENIKEQNLVLCDMVKDQNKLIAKLVVINPTLASNGEATEILKLMEDKDIKDGVDNDSENEINNI